MFQIRWEIITGGTGLCEWAKLDGIEEAERTNWSYAMILTFLIYIVTLHLPKLSSALSFALHRHLKLLHLVWHKPPTAHFYSQSDEQAHRHNQIHIVHTAPVSLYLWNSEHGDHLETDNSTGTRRPDKTTSLAATLSEVIAIQLCYWVCFCLFKTTVYIIYSCH